MRLNRLAVVLLVGLMAWPVLGQVILDRNLGTEPPTADPALSTDTTSVEIVEQMFLGLVDLDEETMAPVPELATAWEPTFPIWPQPPSPEASLLRLTEPL